MKFIRSDGTYTDRNSSEVDYLDAHGKPRAFVRVYEYGPASIAGDSVRGQMASAKVVTFKRVEMALGSRRWFVYRETP